MTEIIFISVFFLGLGYFTSKFFKGMNPFKVLIGVMVILLPVGVGLMEANNNWYTGLFILGFILNYGNPFRGLFNAFEDYKLHRMYQKSLNNQKSNIESDLEEQVNRASSHYSQKEEELRREQERFAREKAEFHRNKSSKARADVKKTVQASIDEAMEILGLEPGFNQRDLKKAYKRESMKYHPDRGGNNPEHIKKLMELKFKEVVSAYNFLEEVFC